MSEYMLDVAAIRKAPVGRVATLSADLFNGPDPVPGIEVELPLEQVKASTIGADVALVAPADLAALCDEVDALCDEVAAKDAENERLRGLLWKASSVIGALVEPQCGNDTGFALRAKAAAVLDDLRAALREEPSHA